LSSISTRCAHPTIAVGLFILLCGCAAQTLHISTVRDEKLEFFVAAEGRRILSVSENSRQAQLYQFHLVNFPRKDILGLSTGNHQIFINYELTRLAYDSESYRWIFRQTLAHEIAHDVLGRKPFKRRESAEPIRGLANSITGQDLGLTGNAPFYSYSQDSELEADSKGIEYWQRIGWDCRIWIRIFRNFQNQGYQGDFEHPTQERLDQAIKLCRQTSPLNP
jgi:predicted Zn-dependent protease